eukprot:10189632-Prorocentrum_lima.AAC.1
MHVACFPTGDCRFAPCKSFAPSSFSLDLGHPVTPPCKSPGKSGSMLLLFSTIFPIPQHPIRLVTPCTCAGKKCARMEHCWPQH